MDGLIWFLCCYGFPIFILLLAAPVKTMMPWASARYSHDYYAKIKNEEVCAEKRKPFMALARYSALIVGILLLASVLVVDLLLPIAARPTNIICVTLGVLALAIWIVWDKKAKNK